VSFSDGESSAPSFIHLRCHSEYSISDSILRIDDAIDAAREAHMPAFALTDLNNLFGLIKFYKAARAAGIKPIIGAEVSVFSENPNAPPYRVLLLAQTHEGYLNLCALLTRMYQERHAHKKHLAVKREWLVELHSGLILFSGARGSDIGEHLLQGNFDEAKRAAEQWSHDFPDRFYLEVQRDGDEQRRDADEALLLSVVALARCLQLPPVATHPIQFLKKDDFRAHDARVCIAEGYILSDPRRAHSFTAEQYFVSPQEMCERFSDLPEALQNTVEIARRCNVVIPLGTPRLPHFPTPDQISVNDFLRSEAFAGLEKRLTALYPDTQEREARWTEYKERLEFELKTIIQMDFPGYFLIVADFINWAKENGVPVGPGRGSGAGSLVAFSLGITELDPLRYALLFERFLNPERKSMPDFDIDFCQVNREKVIEYVRHRYGSDSVSQIVTFGTMAAKGVVRDVGRVLDFPYMFCDGIAKLIPFTPGGKITLAEARQQEPQLKERENNEEAVREILSLAGQLEGLTRNVGMHAGGVLIAPSKLTDFCPLYCQPDSDAAVSQFDKDDVEAIGLVKFDFLGLMTLTILECTLKYVHALHPEIKISLSHLPLDDAPTYELYARGDTTAIFQFESRGMREYLVKARPDCIEDIIALVALYRPGPMDWIPEYLSRKSGRTKTEYLDPRMEPVLKETYGIMVYQEQVMQVAQVIGGYSLGDADILRRAMGKKKPEEMAMQRDVFINGAAKNGVHSAKAAAIFESMEKFAGYGFNKSHAACYAILSYQTAYLKTHYPAAFMAANLTLVMHDSDKVRLFYKDTLARGIAVLPPNINDPAWSFDPMDDQTVRFGLGAIKGTGQHAIENIVKVHREGGAFTDFFDFCRRIDRHLVNRRSVEALIRAGAFDALHKNRAALVKSLPLAFDAADQISASAGQSSLFSEEIMPPTPLLADEASWTTNQQLFEEKTVLGFFLSGHPFRQYQEELKPLTTPLTNLKPQKETVTVAGIVTALRIQNSKRGRSAFITLDDGEDVIELIIFSEEFEKSRHLIQVDRLLIVDVKVTQRMQESDEEQQSLRISAVALHDLSEVRAAYAKCLLIQCTAETQSAILLDELRRLRPKTGQGVPVEVWFYNDIACGSIRLKEESVALDDETLSSIKALRGVLNVYFLYEPETQGFGKK
jgi:DNA polymerase-3 subunit alpha